ncbi:hypothetical protein Tco_1132218 [Tanacetum coccineum]|uniref:Uncharacterized protein n=1 Tax=Tanacetum coccineum TaxID=301880 RepID=A0ABQ5JBA4_9ASTR
MKISLQLVLQKDEILIEKMNKNSSWIVPEEEEKIDYEVLGTRIMFESKEDDELWKNQEEWKLQSWIFYENCGVHVLRLEDGTEINMLAERRYPLTKNTLERMMDLRLTTITNEIQYLICYGF